MGPVSPRRLKSLVSVIEPTSGSITVEGLPLTENRFAIKKSIGYVPDTPDMFLALTAGEYWDLLAAAYEMSQEDKNRRLEES